MNDTDTEGDETITVSGEIRGPGRLASADITITDNEGPEITFETAHGVSRRRVRCYVYRQAGRQPHHQRHGALPDRSLRRHWLPLEQDYTAVDSTITFTPTDSTKTVTVSTTSDDIFELPENFTVSLSNAQGGGGATPVIKDATRTTTINDNFTDDPAYPDSYTVTASPATVGEGDGATPITFTATIDGDKRFASNAVQVRRLPVLRGRHRGVHRRLHHQRGSRASDHPANAASASGTLTITPVDDSTIEDDESIVFTSAAGGGMTASGDTTVTLEDNDAASSITLSVSPSVLREGDSDTAD